MTRHTKTGNDRYWEVSPRSHRRDSAWRAMIEGPLHPMEEPGFFARIFGR
jgi:hypothetical protein